MQRRCTCKSTKNYSRYGGRGISICDEWNDFKTFKEWCFVSGYHDGLTIDRIDNDGNYAPNNCRWTTNQEQANNRRSNNIITYKGFTGSLADLCRHFNKDYLFVNNRIQKGWNQKRALDIGPYESDEKKRMITFNGKTQSISEWTKELGFNKNTISERLRSGRTIEEALTKPVNRKGV